MHASVILASFLSLKFVIRLGHLISKTATVDEDKGGGRIWKRILPLPPIDFSCRFYLCHFKTEQFGAKFMFKSGHTDPTTAQVERKRKICRNQGRLLYLGGSPRVLLHFNTTMEIEGTGSIVTGLCVVSNLVTSCGFVIIGQ